jgi:hypothetical protein
MLLFGFFPELGQSLLRVRSSAPRRRLLRHGHA